MFDDWRNIALIALCAVVAVQWFDRTTQTPSSTGSAYEQLKENIARAQTEVVEQIVLPQIDKTIKERIKQSQITMAGTVGSAAGGSYTDRKGKQTKTTTKYPKYVSTELAWVSETGERFPLGTVFYNRETNTWRGKAYNLNFDTKIVAQKKYDGTHEVYVETSASHQNLKPEHGGKKNFPLKITNASFQIVEPHELVWSWWNPTLSAGIAATAGDHNASFLLKINTINYGHTKQLPVYQFLSPAALFVNGDVLPAVEVGSINIGRWAPMLKDTHIGGGILYSPQHKIRPFLDFTTTF